MTTAQIAHILLWGQAEGSLQVLQELLEREGFSIRSANRISEIITPCLRREFCVALLVIESTSGLGIERQLEMLRILHQLDPRLPVVVMVDDESLEFERKVRAQGVFYLMTRPISNREIRKVIECAIAKSRGGHCSQRPPKDPQ